MSGLKSSLKKYEEMCKSTIIDVLMRGETIEICDGVLMLARDSYKCDECGHEGVKEDIIFRDHPLTSRKEAKVFCYSCVFGEIKTN